MKSWILSIVVAALIGVCLSGCGTAHQAVSKSGRVAAHGLHKTGNALHHAGNEIAQHTP